MVIQDIVWFCVAWLFIFYFAFGYRMCDSNMAGKRWCGESFFMQIASVSATGKTTRFILVSDIFISRERKCRSGVHPMTFAHNHSRTFRYSFFILPGTFIRWNTWEVRSQRMFTD